MRYSRTFKCSKCGSTHKVVSDRDNLDAKEILRVQKCVRRRVKWTLMTYLTLNKRI